MVPERPRRRPSLRASWLAVAGLLLVGNMAFGTASASAATQTISNPLGPLTRVVISDQLNCQVNHASDTRNEFFPPTGDIGACTTQIAVGGGLYGPADIPFGNDPTPFKPVSQSPVTGLGIAGNPYRIETVVDVGTTGLQITETDSYVVGREFYRTEVKVENFGTTAQNVVLYRAGDCFLQDSDAGFGRVNPATGEVACVGPADPNDASAGPGSRIEQWTPISPGSTYYEAQFEQLWGYIGTRAPFDDFCRCTDFVDNAAGLSWSFAVPAGGSATRTHLTTFSPLGVQPRACSDDRDNDGDGRTDHPDDPGCSSPEDNDEADLPPAPQCSDGEDNDGDGRTDHPKDPGCSSPDDNNETNPAAPPARCTITGSARGEVIRGTAGDDVICAGGGDDVVYGRGGNDVVRGGGGDDVLRGGDGSDRIDGGEGNDVLYGGDSPDRLAGGEGNDSVYGGAGSDRLAGQQGRDSLHTRDGTRGNDVADGGLGADSCATDPRDVRRSC